MFVALETQLYGALIDTTDSAIDQIRDLYVTERLSGYKDKTRDVALSRMPVDIQAIADMHNGKRRLGIIELDLIDFILHCRANRVLFLTGGIGVGKTTFIRYVLQTVRSEAPSLLKFRPIILNGLAFPTPSPTYRDLLIELCRAIKRDASDVYSENPVYQSILSVPARSFNDVGAPLRSEADASEFVGIVRTFAAALGSGSEAIFVFDNLDHLEIESVCNITVLARSAHINSSSGFIVALRLAMLQAVREHVSGRGGFTPFLINVSPPDLRAVIRARMRKTFREYETAQARSASGGAMFVLKDPEKSVNSLSDKLLRPKSQERFMRGICGNNVRKALSAFAYFCRYRDLDYTLILAISPASDSYVPIRQGSLDDHFLDGLMIGDRQYFTDGHGTPVTNVLFFEDAGKTDYLILYQCLALLGWSSKHLKTIRLVNWLNAFGHDSEFSLAAIRHLRVRALISARNAEGTVEMDTQIEISESGLYYLQELLVDPQYIKNSIYDVPLRHEGWTEAVSSHFIPQLESASELIETTFQKEHECISRACLGDSPLELCGAIQSAGLLSRKLIVAALALAERGERSAIAHIQTSATDSKNRLQGVEALVFKDEVRIADALKARGFLPKSGIASRIIEDRLGDTCIVRMKVPTSLAPALRNAVSIEFDLPNVDDSAPLVALWQAVDGDQSHREIVKLNRVAGSETFKAQFVIGGVTESMPFPQSKVTVFSSTRPVLVYRTTEEH